MLEIKKMCCLFPLSVWVLFGISAGLGIALELLPEGNYFRQMVAGAGLAFFLSGYVVVRVKRGPANWHTPYSQDQRQQTRDDATS